MATAIALIVLALILFFACRYIYREKKRGAACIGCPSSGTCPKHQGTCCCERNDS